MRNPTQPKLLVLVSREHEALTAHLLESYRIRLDELEDSTFDLDAFYTPLSLSMPTFMGKILTNSAYDVCISAACFLKTFSSTASLDYQQVLSGCQQITIEHNLIHLPMLIQAEDEEAARDHIFGPVEMKGYQIAQATVDSLQVLRDLP